MSPRPTWLHTRSTELRSAFLDLALTITDTEAWKTLDDKEAVTGLSLLSTLGMITADASAFLVTTPRPMLLRIT